MVILFILIVYKYWEPVYRWYMVEEGCKSKVLAIHGFQVTSEHIELIKNV